MGELMAPNGGPKVINSRPNVMLLGPRVLPLHSLPCLQHVLGRRCRSVERKVRGQFVSEYQLATSLAIVFFASLAIVSFWKAAAARARAYPNIIGLNIAGTLSALTAMVFAVFLFRTL